MAKRIRKPAAVRRRLDGAKEWRRKYPDRARAITSRHYQKNREKCLLATKKWKKNNADAVRNKDLLRQYGITLAEVQALWERQLWTCAICPEPLRGPRNVDHCHGTKRVRGLLCDGCNWGLGHFKDNTDLLRSAIEYLDRNR